MSNNLVTLFIGKTNKSLHEKIFYSNDEIILEPVNRFISCKPFIKSNMRRGKRYLMLYRIVYEDGSYKEKTPNMSCNTSISECVALLSVHNNLITFWR